MNQQRDLEIAVVGAGIIGVSAAYFLQKLGARVTLIDKSFVGDCIPKLGLTKVMAYCKKTQPNPLTERGMALAQILASELGYCGSLGDIDDEASVTDNRST
ncbi:MAG: FAD-dependent oxidoreductase, partial [Pseudomonas sp.]|uniref:FAD-dependent oxidoreductase n=1 Tax=Pseudomonas sp. TaxID=306 RepID=UPI003D6FA9E9